MASMESNDLKWIKKHYGEEMMHFCRSAFPSVLEEEGRLSYILQTHFAQSKSLIKDIKDQQAEQDFINFIRSLANKDKVEKKSTIETAEQLMENAGYILYPECETEADIQRFKKYWAPGEELCTFRGGRLQSCRVWFAVKKDVDQIKREDFKTPTRQDEYGTSAISIQFTKNGSNLSIKNRYNHTVVNPDNTFSNNLDNIVEGLTLAFEQEYGVMDKSSSLSRIELKNYVEVNGKYYHYNYEINNIYYCDNNIIIDNFKVKQLPESQILAGYHIFDKQKKTVELYDKSISDSFSDGFKDIESIEQTGKNGKDKEIIVKVKNGEDIVVGLNEHDDIQAYTNNNLKQCGDDFLAYNNVLAEINLPKLTSCGQSFLFYNNTLTSVILPQLTSCGNCFLGENNTLTNINLPNLTSCGDEFLYCNEKLTNINLPNLTSCGDDFLYRNEKLTDINLPNLTRCGNYFLGENNTLTNINLPNLTSCGDDFLYYNNTLTNINLPNLTSCGDYFLFWNYTLTNINLPKLKKWRWCFLEKNTLLKNLKVPKLSRKDKRIFNDHLKQLLSTEKSGEEKEI